MKTTPDSSRRNFIKKTALLSAASVLPIPNFAMKKAFKYKMGLQLFTIRDAMEKDPLGSLKIVADLGYEDLETYGYDVNTDSYYGYKASEFKRILDNLDLTATSGHYGFADYFDANAEVLRRYVDQCITGAKALDKRYITWPWLNPKHRTLDNFKLLAEKLNTIATQVTDSGLGFAYHNHDFEFTEHDGQTGYDILLKETDPQLVKLQMDLYWVVHSSKLSPAELIANQPGRYVMWHIKDMDKVTRDYTELGNGSIDYRSMLAEINTDALEYYYLEQGGNFAQNSIQSITDSAVYFKKNLQRYL